MLTATQKERIDKLIEEKGGETEGLFAFIEELSFTGDDQSDQAVQQALFREIASQYANGGKEAVLRHTLETAALQQINENLQSGITTIISLAQKTEASPQILEAVLAETRMNITVLYDIALEDAKKAA